MSGKSDQEDIQAEVAPDVTPVGTSDENVSPEPASPPETAPTTRDCPYCARTLDIRAVTCRFCGRDLYAENAMKIVLTSEEWDTNVPQWMIEAENKMLERKKLFKRIRKQSWRVVLGIIALGVTIIVWRLLTAPPEPHQQMLAVRDTGLIARPATPLAATPAPPATPAPTIPSLSQSAVASAFGSDINPRGGNPIDDNAEDISNLPDNGPAPEPTPNTTEPESTVPTNEPASPAANVDLTQSEYEIHINAEDLAAEFEEARTFADDKYLGQRVQITGELKTIDTTTKVPYVVFNTGRRNTIKCLLKPEARKQLYRVKPGKLVSIRGKCDGAFLDIVISDCEFLF